VLVRVRSQIATDLHDDIGASLSQVAIVSEVVRRQVGPHAGTAGERLKEIAEVSRGLVDSMSDIVWAINPQRDSVQDVVQRMRRVASDTLSARGIELRFTAPVSDGAAPLGPGLRREVYLVFKEALHNVVKHAQCRSVDVEIDVKPAAFHFAVRDDGRGFDPAGSRDGHGLTSMARRAERLGGSLSVEGGPGKGTRVRLMVPLHRRSFGWVRRSPPT
jgi:signal transduction histidine kinase